MDETVSFVQKPGGTYGWTIMANDPKMAIDMMDDWSADGHGAVPMFVGKEWDTNDPAEISIDDVLADADVQAETAKAIAEVDHQVQILLDETGLP